MITTKKTFVGAFIAFVAFFGIASQASALTMAELDAYIAQGFTAEWIMANVSDDSGSNDGSATCGTTTYGYTATSTLSQGMSGAAVSALQSALNNYANASLATDGSFGPATKAAVVAFQASKSLSQDGVAGPATQGALQNASAMTGGDCDDDSDDSDDSVDLNGEAGSVSSYETMSQYANEQVGEGEEDAEIAGLRIEADSGSDLGITSIKLKFAQNTAADSTDMGDYIEEVSVWFDGEMVGSADADEFTEDSSDDWTKTISLDGVVIEAEEEGELVVAVTAVPSMDSGDIDTDAWTVDFTTVRFVDGQDVVTSDGDSTINTTAVSFDFGSFATAADIEMQVSLSNDNMDARVEEVDSTSDTDGVELMKFTIEADGSDIEINDLPVLLTTAGAADVDLVTNSLTLEADGEEWTETVSTSSLTAATITFDDLNFTINDGDEVTFTVTADINDIESGSFDEGDTLKAELRAVEVDAIDADDEQGDNISDADATGTALGEEVAFYTTGIMVTDFSSDVVNYSTDTADTDTGEFTMTFTVEAFGGTVYVADTATVTTVSTIPDTVLTSGGIRYRLTDSGTATDDDQATDVDFSEDNGADDSSNGQIALEEGESTTISITVTQTNNDAGDDGIYRAYIQAILWNTTDATNLYNVYDFNLEDFETDAISLN